MSENHSGIETRVALESLHTRPERLRSNAAPLKSQATSLAPSGILRLPFEIRTQIYRYLIPRNRIVNVPRPRFNKLLLPRVENNAPADSKDFWVSMGDPHWPHEIKHNNSIFLLCKQISAEALNVLYGENIFESTKYGEGDYYFRSTFAASNLRRLRVVRITVQPMGLPFEGNIDESFWASFLQTLEVLRIVAVQPIEARSFYDAPTPEQDKDHWLNWLRSMLECFAESSSRDTVIEVDDNGRIETRELFKRYLPGHREVQCHSTGDFLFKRGRFSLESGYWDN